MSLPGAVIDAMVAAGCSAEQLAAAVKAANADAEKAAETKRAKAAERKRRQRERESHGDADSHAMSRGQSVTECDGEGQKQGFPQTPFQEKHTPPSPPKGGSSPTELEGFEEFWSLYPHKVGKPDARSKFAKATRKADLATIMAGLKAYVAKTDDRPWCNPATWLHQERWADQPAQVARGSPPSKPRSVQDAANDLVTRMRNADRPDQDRSTDYPLALGFSANGQH